MLCLMHSVKVCVHFYRNRGSVLERVRSSARRCTPLTTAHTKGSFRGDHTVTDMGVLCNLSFGLDQLY